MSGKLLIIALGVAGLLWQSAAGQAVELTTNTVDSGFVVVRGPAGSWNVLVGSTSGDRGAVWVCNENGDVKAAVYVDPIGGEGWVSADVKNFRTLNPREPNTDIVYACIEGPEAAAYVRGTARLVDGRATVELPPHFVDVALSEGMTVQLTPRSAESRGLAVVEQSVERFTVGELFEGRGDYEFHWRVTAVRRGYEDYQVIQPRLEPPTLSRSASDRADRATDPSSGTVGHELEEATVASPRSSALAHK